MTPPATDLTGFADAANRILAKYDDKDWNYSRILLVTRTLQSLDSAYFLVPDSIDPRNAEGRQALRDLVKELAWGERHSNELGVLELVSLRVNHALVELSGGPHAKEEIPVVRVVPRQSVEPKPGTQVLWYEVVEVSGEDFDSR